MIITINIYLTVFLTVTICEIRFDMHTVRKDLDMADKPKKIVCHQKGCVIIPCASFLIARRSVFYIGTCIHL